jgi:enoyl-CoA hydratase/3-hydroxyacyl-CoA dehydrogenase
MKIDLPVALDFYPLEGDKQTRINAFFENLKKGRLTTTKCKKCGKVHWHPRVVCDGCSSDDLEWTDLPKFGKLAEYTAMTVGAPMGFERDLPFVMGMVEFPGLDIKVASRIDGLRYEDAFFGMDVEFKTVYLEDGRVFFRFKPRSTPDDILAGIKKVVIVGAGNMGSGIAQSFAQAGYEVSLMDIEQRFVDAGFARIRAPLEKRVAKGKMRREDLDAMMARIKGFTVMKEAVEGAGLVIEAVFEDLAVKNKLFAELDAVCAPTTILASNTSSLSITEMAKATGRPERFVGLHYFYPAAVNQLLEVVAGEKTAPEVVKAMLELGRNTGKIPIEVADAPGFAVNRFFVPWLNEACRIVEGGLANPITVDEAAKDAFKIGMGPFELMNATGVPIAFHAETSLAKGLGRFYEPANILKTQAGLNKPWEIKGEVDKAKFEAIGNRLLAVTWGIAVKLVEEKVSSIEDTDTGATTGLRWRAGPFAMMNALGAKRSAALLQKFARESKYDFPLPQMKELKAGKPWAARTVKLVRDGSVATLIMNRPDQMNALNGAVFDDLDDIVTELEKDKAVRVVIVTGEGRAFIAGADIKEMSEKDPAQMRTFTAHGQQVLRRLEKLGKPVIAAINGFALGGGMELALACDIRLASERARFGLPEVKLGIFPGLGGTQRLTRLVGKGPACELIFCGDIIDPATALRMGLVDKVVCPERLMPEAREIARRISANAPIAVALAKSSINKALETDLEAGLKYELDTVMKCMPTKDKKEGMQAFIEKRRPDFRGE